MSKRGIDQFTTALGAGPKTQRVPECPEPLAAWWDPRPLIVWGAAGGWAQHAVPLSRLPFPLHECCWFAAVAQQPLGHALFGLPHPLLTLRAATSSAVSEPSASPGSSCRCRTPSRPGCQWPRWEPAPHPARSSCFSSRLSPQNTSLVPPPARTTSCNKLGLLHPICFLQLAACWECIIYRYKSVSPFASQYRSLMRQISKVVYCKDCKITLQIHPRLSLAADVF